MNNYYIVKRTAQDGSVSYLSLVSCLYEKFSQQATLAIAFPNTSMATAFKDYCTIKDVGSTFTVANVSITDS